MLDFVHQQIKVFTRMEAQFADSAPGVSQAASEAIQKLQQHIEVNGRQFNPEPPRKLGQLHLGQEVREQ
ncbi:MAG: hypothetical protein F6J89_21295 [Symploca sp. SIO1C4]|uniref:Uncharacterized protein n=1 Tax=Symploca sp. SIO1C4 TaxID=2607765 RepID=A0A6B3NJ11_9CYAN|nr:hypothetical protein [Symploca sp. SIO1C4]